MRIDGKRSTVSAKNGENREKQVSCFTFAQEASKMANTDVPNLIFTFRRRLGLEPR